MPKREHCPSSDAPDMGKGQTSSESCAWPTHILDLSHQINCIIDKSKPISSYNQCAVLKSLVNNTAQYVKSWWMDEQSEDAKEVGNQLLGVLKRGMQVLRRCEDEDSQSAISLLGGADGECSKIIDDVRKCCQMMNELIVVDRRRDKVEQDCNILQNHLLFAHEKDKKAFQLLGAVNIKQSDLRKLENLGTGSSAIVWKAIWLNVPISFKRFLLNKESLVAVKEFFHDDHFESEYEVFKELKDKNCSHIVQIFGDTTIVENNTSRKGLIMELMDMDLKTLIEQKNKIKPGSPFSLDESIHIMLQIAKGLRNLHGVRVVHRDIKPLNILVKSREDGSFCVKLADFNTSKTSFETAITNTDKKGTMLYMAPEMFADTCRYSKKVDVYSFGVLCIEILIGEPPDSNMLKALPEVIPKDLQELIYCCLKQEEDLRPTFKCICDTLGRLEQENTNLCDTLECPKQGNTKLC